MQFYMRLLIERDDAGFYNDDGASQDESVVWANTPEAMREVIAATRSSCNDMEKYLDGFNPKQHV